MQSRKLLLVFDLNGILVDRIAKTGKDRPRYLRLRSNPHAPAEPDLRAKSRLVYFRPAVHDFISHVLNHTHIEMAIWTSGMKQNVSPVVSSLFKNHNHRLKLTWYRDKCTIPDPERFDVVYKDLDRLWKTDSRWTPLNTVLVDDSPLKGSIHPRNLLYVPSYDVSLCRKDVNDTVLTELKAYLNEVADAFHKDDQLDIRDYLELHPFKPLNRLDDLCLSTSQLKVVD